MSKNEHIYSYVERKIIDENIKHTFNEKRYKVKKINNDNKNSLKALLIGAALGFIVVVILILRDLYIY